MVKSRLKTMTFLPQVPVKKGIEYKHTKVPGALGGRGIAGSLVKTILDDAAKGLRVKPTCPYVKAYIDKHPEYQDNSVFHNAAP